MFLSRDDDGRLRMRPDIILEEPQYAGIKSSRKQALEEEDSLDSDDDLNFHPTDNWSMDEMFEDQPVSGESWMFIKVNCFLNNTMDYPVSRFLRFIEHCSYIIFL